MRRSFPPIVEVLSGPKGFIVAFTRNGKSEFLGSDGLWHRQPKHCDPFIERADAEAKADAVKEGVI